LLKGTTVIGDRCDIGPDAHLDGCVIGADCNVGQTGGVDAEVGAGAVVGPVAHLPAGSHGAAGVTTGAFYTASAEG
jgi:bifunctional UDP-N-acetylglucosamine pyrophosphorylase/glucosamine-1-phosphate N-acetyltransferase